MAPTMRISAASQRKPALLPPSHREPWGTQELTGVLGVEAGDVHAQLVGKAVGTHLRAAGERL